ncbi:PAS domain-containing protein [Hwanghaeella grinnelliae]|uniref:histidine kinase n=1 Tax=Hwanghaeella grinnelliae TaxID=2500179 RepID=A0A3S2WTA0_9PROT|nr:PAS-domain containing protein [Hwanghaeella grinnelliae]RVU37974.1 PAS domain-containing protein [Hwanghaeella grinnelliae]
MTTKLDIDPIVLADALENLGQGVSYFDQDLVLVYCNTHYLRLLEFPEELGQPGTPADAFLRYNAERGEYGDGDVETLVQERMELARQFQPHVLERVRPDGQVLRIQGYPIENGGFVTTYQDITELRRYQSELEKANERLDERVRERTKELAEREQELKRKTETLERILESVEQGISLCDRNLDLVVANRRCGELLGFPADLLKPGTPFFDFMLFNAKRGEYGSGDPVQLAKQREELARQFQPHRFKRERPDGTVLEVVGFPVPEGFVTTYTDITEQKKTESLLRAAKLELEMRVEDRTAELQRQLRETERAQEEMSHAKDRAEQASKAKSDFLAQMSHELRTPLNSIIGFSDIIRSEVFGPVENNRYKEYIEGVHFSGVHLLSLINDILELTRLEAGKVALVEDRVGLSSHADEVILQLRERARAGGVDLKNRIPSTSIEVKGDSRRIYQMLLNLLSNAIKFTPKGGAVSVFTEDREDGRLALGVKDDGVGMSLEEISQALEPFTQVGGSVLNTQEGSGLGLSIVKGLIEQHGGTIDIASKPGEGTIVRLIFPKDRTLSGAL